MTGHDADAGDGGGREQGVGGVYRPWTPGSADRTFDDPDADGWVDERDPFTRAASEQDREPGARLRRPPSGMGRRDRREWKMLEAARVHRLRTDELRSAPEGSFRPGFSRPRRSTWTGGAAGRGWPPNGNRPNLGGSTAALRPGTSATANAERWRLL